MDDAEANNADEDEEQEDRYMDNDDDGSLSSEQEEDLCSGALSLLVSLIEVNTPTELGTLSRPFATVGAEHSQRIGNLLHDLFKVRLHCLFSPSVIFS